MKNRTRFLLAAGGVAMLLTGAIPANANVAAFDSNGDTWTGGGTIADPHVQASCATSDEPLPIVEAACPTFTFVIGGTDPMRYLDVELVFDDVSANGKAAEDYDLHLFDESGEEVASAAGAIANKELLAANHLPNGTYTLQVVPYINIPGSTFTLEATFRTAQS